LRYELFPFKVNQQVRDQWVFCMRKALYEIAMPDDRNKTALPGLILPFRHPLKYKASAAVHLSSVYFFILKLVANNRPK
jgi:hypothetical protein